MKKKYNVQITIEQLNDLQYIKPFEGLRILVNSSKTFYFWDNENSEFKLETSASGAERTEEEIIAPANAQWARGIINLPNNNEINVEPILPGEFGNQFYLYVEDLNGTPNLDLSAAYIEQWGEGSLPTVVITLATDNNGDLDPTKNRLLDIGNLILENFRITYQGTSATVVDQGYESVQFENGEDEIIGTPGIQGQIKYSNNYLFICTEENIWRGTRIYDLNELYEM